MILGGSVVSAAGAFSILAYALVGRNPRVVTAPFVPLTFGMGLRRPPGIRPTLGVGGRRALLH